MKSKGYKRWTTLKILFRMELGNIIAAAFVFSQFISEKQFSLQLFTLGFIIAIISYVISYLVIK